ncbi:hypothetical protein LTR95_013731 [Oleoguttula sp. CCFEE 5521]
MPSFADIRQFVAKRSKLLHFPRLRSVARQALSLAPTPGLDWNVRDICECQHAALNVSRLILACRSVERGEEARKAIVQSRPDCKTVIEVVTIDMSDNESVIAFANNIATSFDRVDALIANAGIDTLSFKLVNGDESTLAVNVVGTMLLAIKMLPTLQETATLIASPTHLIVVGSTLLHRTANLRLIPRVRSSRH